MVDDKQVRRSLWVGDLSVFESRLPYNYAHIININKTIIIINIKEVKLLKRNKEKKNKHTNNIISLRRYHGRVVNARYC